MHLETLLLRAAVSGYLGAHVIYSSSFQRVCVAFFAVVVVTWCRLQLLHDVRAFRTLALAFSLAYCVEPWLDR